MFRRNTEQLNGFVSERVIVPMWCCVQCKTENIAYKAIELNAKNAYMYVYKFISSQLPFSFSSAELLIRMTYTSLLFVVFSIRFVL